MTNARVPLGELVSGAATARWMIGEKVGATPAAGINGYGCSGHP